MAEDVEAQLKAILDRLDRAQPQDPTSAEDRATRALGEAAARAIGASSGTPRDPSAPGTAPASGTPAIPGDERHASLVEIMQLARDRHAAAPGEWQMPEHLASCPLCLEAFEAVLDGVPAPSAEFLERCARMLRPAPRHQWLFRRAAIMAAAAVVMLLAVLSLSLYFGGNTSATLRHGQLVLQDGTPLESGRIPASTEFIATQDTHMVLGDGSDVHIDRDTLMAIRERGGDVTIELLRGTVAASVTKRENGKIFGVRTPLGEITVVGTRFSVACDREDVKVFQHDPSGSSRSYQTHITAVTVRVAEGVVLVKNARDEVRVHAGEMAVMRDNPPTIDLLGVTP